MTQERVLLVEDNEDNLQLVRFLLERSGYTVLSAHNGREGIDIARREIPNLILMDLSLPEIDGWEAAQELKADPHTKPIPLLALTAHTLPGDRQRALSLGFDGYISKPIDVAAFEGSISKALMNRKTRPIM
jgi:two-component system, cell cycle response regulator DivK